MFIYIRFLLPLLILTESLKSSKIPKTGTPPDTRKFSSSTYDKIHNRMIIFAGSSNQREYYNDVWCFQFNNSEWSQINPSTTVAPEPRVSPSLFYDENKNRIIIFGGKTYLGVVADIWSFSLDYYTWEQINFEGEKIKPTSFATYISFFWNDIPYHAIFGGETIDSVNNRLYLLEFENLTSVLMPSNGDLPTGTQNVMAFYKDSIYVWGGFRSDYSYDTNLYAYNLTAQIWKNIELEGSTPPGRIYHFVGVYSNFLYVFPGFNYNYNEDVIDIWRINLENLKSWEQMNYNLNSDTNPRGYATSILVDSILYQFSGSTITNDLISIDLSISIPNFSTISDQWASPPARMRFSMALVNTNIVVFGGMGNNGELYNDLWVFDLKKETWKSIESSGLPSARSGQATAQSLFGMAIFGGENNDGLLNDFYIFSLAMQTWYSISISLNFPSPRKGACMYFIDLYVILYGGITKTGTANDIWIFNIFELTWTELTSYNSEAPSLAWHQCFSEEQSEGYNYYAFFGQLSNGMPNRYLYKFNLSSRTWTFITTIGDKVGLSPSEASGVLFNNYIIIIGGEFGDYYVSDSITSFSVKNFTVVSQESMGVHLFAHQSVYFTDKLYIFGGGLAINTLLTGKLTSSTLYKISFEDSAIRYPCSLGSYKNNSECLVCPFGTYSSDYDSSECTKCPEGTYLNKYGAQAKSLCIPCLSGSYADETGTALCKNCPAGMHCEIGSTSPIPKYFLPSESSKQPSQYKGGADIVNYWATIFEIINGINIFVVVLCAIISKKFWNSIAKADMFDTQHNKDNQPMWKRKTAIGGLFSLIGKFWAIFLVLILVLQRLYDNITETISLIPILNLEQEAGKVSADILVVITLYNYGGSCVQNGTCVNGVSLSWSNTVNDYITMECQFIDKNCFVFSTCKSCSLSSSSSLKLGLFESNSYSSYFSVNLTSDSSIPGESSSYATYIYPPNGYFFIGSDPTKVNFIMTSCLFLSESSTWQNNQTGYVVSLGSTELGSVKTAEMMTFNRYFSIQINFNIDLSGLLVVRAISMNFLLFVSSAFGAVSGLLEFVGWFMEKFEEFYDEKKEKLQNRRERQEQVKKASRLISIFQKFYTYKIVSKDSTFDFENRCFTENFPDA